MANIVISGDTSGSVTLSAPAVSGTTTLTLPTTSGTVLTTASTTGVNASAITTGMLDQAYGGTGTTVGYNGFKNRIINGAMQIDQRNAGASVTPTADGTYTLDRWQFSLSAASKFSAQQSSTAPTGFVNSNLITSLSAYSVPAGGYFMFNQPIEGLNMADLAWGTASASAVTLSFWVRSSLTGTFGGAIQNSAQNRAYPFSYTISSANTWEQKTITIAGDTTGTWLTTNGVGMFVRLGLGVGSNFSTTANAWTAGQYFSCTGATSVVGTSGATFYITGVQLEKGSTATSFDYRPYGTELALCQRYFQTYQKPVGRGLMNGTVNLGRVGLPLQVQMRASPTMNISGTIDWFDAYGTGTITALNATYTTTNAIEFDAIAATGTTSIGRPCTLYNGSNTGSLVASAEL